MDADATTRCLDAEGSWKDVAVDIRAVCGGSKTGARLLGKALKAMDQEDVTSRIDTHVQKLGANDITPKTITDQLTLFLDDMRSRGCEPTTRFVPAKEVTIQYRGQPVKLVVASALEFYNLAAAALVRSRAVDNSDLPSMWAENELVGHRPVQAKKVDKECVRHARMSRMTVLDLLLDEDATGELIKKTIDTRLNFLMQTDRSWKIEHGFWASVVGAGAGEKVQYAILDCLPKTNAVISLLQVKGRLDKLAAGKLMSFAGGQHQSQLKSILSMITRMAADRAPDMDKVSDSSFGKTMKQRLSLLCVHPLPSAAASSSASVVPLVSGAEAAKRGLKDLEKTAGAGLTYEMVSKLLPFSWLLDLAGRRKLIEITNVVLAGRAAAPDVSTAKKAKTSASERKAMVKALFKK